MNYFQATMSHRDDQGGEAAQVVDINLCSCIQQHPHDVAPTFVGSAHQCRPAFVIDSVDTCPSSEEWTHYAVVAIFSCNNQGCSFVVDSGLNVRVSTQ